MRRFLVIILLMLASGSKATEQSWRVLTEPFPPYFAPELPNNGWMHDLVVSALHNQNIKATIEYVAWSRAMRLAGNGGAVAVLGAYKTSKRQNNYFYSRAIGKSDTGFFAKTSLELAMPLKISELKKYVIAKGEEYVVAEGVEDHPDLSFTQTSDLITSLYMLLGDRVDLVAGTRQVGEHWLRNHSRLKRHPKLSKVKFVEPAVATQKMYMIFGKALKQNFNRAQQFDKAMAYFVWSAELQTLLARQQLPPSDKENIISFLRSQFENPTTELNRP